MPVLPGLKSAVDAVTKSGKIVERAAALVVAAADRRLGQIAMAVSVGVIALAVKGDVLRLRKAGRVEAMRGAERALHPEEVISLAPIFGEEILALVQSQPLNRQHGRDPGVKILRQALGRFRTVR